VGSPARGRVSAAVNTVTSRRGAELATAAAIACGLGAVLTYRLPAAGRGWLDLAGVLLWGIAVSLVIQYRSGDGWRRRWGLGIGFLGVALAIGLWLLGLLPSFVTGIFLEELAIYLVVAAVEWRHRRSAAGAGP
jgi:hypothetical protein